MKEAIKRAQLARPALIVLHTACVLSIVHFAIAEDRTNRVFDRIVASATDKVTGDEERALALLHEVHRMMWSGKPVFSPKIEPAATSDWRAARDWWSTDPVQLLATAEGGCGSFNIVLAKALERADIEARILHMTCRGELKACHIVLEAKIAGSWAVLDPLFDLSFRNSSQELASFEEVSSSWAEYQLQVPEHRRSASPSSEAFYDTNKYDYSGVSGTNWQKVPVLMPALRSLLAAVLGEERTQYISLGSYAYDSHKFRLQLSLLAYVVVLMLTYRHVVRQRKRSPAASVADVSVTAPSPELE